MATLTPTLTLVSTDAFSHQAINVSVTDSLSVVAPYTDLSRIAAATSGGTELIAATQAVVTYIFLKNTYIFRECVLGVTFCCKHHISHDPFHR
jgi:hypothetical protein